MTAHGITFSSTNAEAIALATCAELEFMKSAILAGGPVIDQANFIAGAQRLGAWALGGDTLSNYFSPVQHDSVGSYEWYDWNNSCQCMDYVGGPHTAVGEGET